MIHKEAHAIFRLMSLSPEEFKATQKASWNLVAQQWKKWWPTFEDGAQKLSDRLVALARIGNGSKVLDIATGIGEPAVTAARMAFPNGKVVATDISEEMLAIARERATELGLESMITFENSDAEMYAYPRSTFDAVLSRWGLMFLPNLVPTLHKIRMSLVSGGILAAAVWSVPEKAPVLMLPLKVAADAAGLPPPAPGSPGPFKLAELSKLENAFMEAGFRNIVAEKFGITFRFKSADQFAKFHREINAPVAVMLKTLPVAIQEQVWKEISRAASRFADGTGVVKLDNEVICITGQH
jgi:SAM-dependent methyltransferase